MESNDFEDRYKKISKTKSGVMQLSDNSIGEIQSSLRAYERMDTRRYIIVTATLLISFAFVPWCFSRMAIFLIENLSFIKSILSQEEYITNNIYVSVSAILFCFGSFVYALTVSFGDRHNFVFKRGFVTLSYSLLVSYISMYIPLIYLVSFDLLDGWRLKAVLCALLFFPVFILSVLPCFVLLVFMVFITRNYSAQKEKRHLYPAVIIDSLVRLLNILIDSNDRYFGPDDVQAKICARINKVTVLLRQMGKTFDKETHIDRYLRSRFVTAGNSFNSLTLCVLLPDGSSRALLIRKAESLLNVFISGNYRNLPQQPYVSFDNVKLVRSRSVLKVLSSFFGFGLFLCLPISIWAAFLWMHNPVVEPSLQTLLSIFYIIWCCVGVLSFSEKFAPDAKGVIMDVFKFVVTKQ